MYASRLTILGRPYPQASRITKHFRIRAVAFVGIRPVGAIQLAVLHLYSNEASSPIRHPIKRGMFGHWQQDGKSLLESIHLNLQDSQVTLNEFHTSNSTPSHGVTDGFHGIAIGRHLPPLRFPRYGAVHPDGSVSRQGLLLSRNHRLRCLKADALSS